MAVEVCTCGIGNPHCGMDNPCNVHPLNKEWDGVSLRPWKVDVTLRVIASSREEALDLADRAVTIADNEIIDYVRGEFTLRPETMER